MSEKVKLRIAGALVLLIFIGFCKSVVQWSTSPERAAKQQQDIAEQEGAIAKCRERVSDGLTSYGIERGSSKVNSADIAVMETGRSDMEACEYNY